MALSDAERQRRYVMRHGIGAKLRRDKIGRRCAAWMREHSPAEYQAIVAAIEAGDDDKDDE